MQRSRNAELVEELRTWCSKRGIGPEEIDPEELQAWCIKHKADPIEARRLIVFAARHGGRWNCSGCEHCAPLRAVTASPGDDVRDVGAVRAAWAERFPLLGGLPSIADALSKATLADLDRDLAVLLRPRADRASGEVEFARRASEASQVRQATLGEATDETRVVRLLEEHRENERLMFVERLAEEIEGMDPDHAAWRIPAAPVMERVDHTDDDGAIPLVGGSVRIVDACEDERRIVRRIPLDDGNTRIIWAQDARHAERARHLVDGDPALLDHLDRLDGVDGIAISTVDTTEMRLIHGLPESMQRAYADLPSLEAQFREAVRKGEEKPDPMSLWSALALDPPARPTKPEIEALKKRAQALRDEHDRFVAGADVLNRNAAEDNAYRALQLRCDALIATREWLVVLRLAKASLRAIAKENVDHRRARVEILVERLDGWNRPEIARLIRESTDGKKPLSPELLRNYPEPAKLERATHHTDLEWEFAQERYAERLQATEARLVDLIRQDIKRVPARKRGRRNAKH